MSTLVPSIAEIQAAIETATEPDAHSVATAFNAAKMPAGDQRWELLTQVFSMMLRPGNVADPLGPISIDNRINMRSMIPDDLTEADLAALRSVFPGPDVPAYRARIGDILWLRERDPDVGRVAAEAYRASAALIEASDHPYEAGSQYERALRLAKQIDKNGSQLREFLDIVRAQAEAVSPERTGRLATDLLRLLYEFRHGDPVELGDLAVRVAVTKTKMDHFPAARTAYDLAAKFWHRTQRPDQADDARAASADTHLAEADSHATALGKHGALREAILAYQKILGRRDRIPALQERLREVGQSVLSSMQSSEFKQDITPLVQQTRAAVSGLPLEDALFTLAIIAPPLDPAAMRKQVEDVLAESPLHGMFATTVLDSAGRTTGVVPGVIGATADEAELGLQHHVHRHAELARNLTCAAAIGPALDVINAEHVFDSADVEPLFTEHPLIEDAYSPYFVRGVLEGLRGDFAVALHLLVPQVESLLRVILYQRGVITTALDKVGIELEWTLGRVLNQQALVEAVGPSMVFELKGLLLADPAGSNVRNNMAHGLLPYRACRSVDGVYLWWIILKLVFCTSPQFRPFKERRQLPCSEG